MEAWQRNHIVSNLSQLIACTSCPPALLAKLHASGILSEDDVEELKTRELHDIPGAQAHAFYNIVMKKNCGYEKLLEALKETNQDKAISILTDEMKNTKDNLEVTEKQALSIEVSTDEGVSITDQRQVDGKLLLDSKETTHLLTGSTHKTENVQNTEDRQKNIIASNLDDLITLTHCSFLLLKILQNSGALSNEEFEKLQLIENLAMQSSELYNIILMKPRGFEELLKALRQTCQTGALHILTEVAELQHESECGSIGLEDSSDSCDTHKGGSQPSPGVEAQTSEMPKLKQTSSIPEAVQSFETRIKVYPTIHFVTTPPWLNEFYFENSNMSILSPNVDLTLDRIQSCDVGGSFGNALTVSDKTMEFLVAPLRNPSDLPIDGQTYEQHKPKTLLLINKSIQKNLTALKERLAVKKEYEETITLKDVDILTWNYLSNYFKIQGRPVTVNLKLAFLRDELTSDELFELIKAAVNHNHLELLHELAQPETPLILLFTPRMCLDKEILNENTDNVFFIASDDMPPHGFTNRTVTYYTAESYSEEITADIVVLNGEEPYLQQYEELQEKTNRIGHLVLWKQSHLQLIASTGGINVLRKFIQSRNFPHDFNEFYKKATEFDPRIVILHSGDEHELEQVGLNFSQELLKANSECCVICTAASSLDSTFKYSSRSDFGTAVLKQCSREQTNLKIEIVIVWKNEINKRALKNDLLYLKGIRVWIIVGDDYKYSLEDEFNTIAWEVDALCMDSGTQKTISVEDPVEADSEYEASYTVKRPKRNVEQRTFIGTESNKQMCNDSILFIAIRKGVDVDVLDKLVKADADEYQVNFNYENVLHICAMHGNASALEYFLRNPTLVNGLDKNLNTPLHLAVRNNCENSERMQTLLINAGADVNARNVADFIPLTLAFESGNGLSLEIINMMEENGLEIKTQLSYEVIKQILFKVGIKDSALPVVEYLLKKEGVSSYPSDHNGQTLLHVASSKHFEKKPEFIEMLISHNADVNFKDFEGKTPLHYAVKHHDHLLNALEITRLLIENGADPDGIDEEGRNFISEACADRTILGFQPGKLKMEHWQVSHIRRNLYNLQQLTTCNSSFRAVLQEHAVLDDNDISQLDATCNSKGRLAESEHLYKLLLTRYGAYTALIDACDRTQQTGALHILKKVLITDSTTWNELSFERKIELESKIVAFQGKEVKLSDCYKKFHHIIDGKFLKELEKGITPTLVNNQVPDQVEYYIQRTLRSRNKLKSSVFQQPCNDVFVVEGMEKFQLTNLVAGVETDVSGNQIECLTVRYILLEYEGDFEKICKLTRFPVHLIKYKNDIYEWVQSSGSLENLQKYVDDDQDCFSEVELASRGNRVNVIFDSPGMGKTALLVDIAHQASKEKPNMLIRFIVLRELAQALNKKPINLESIVSLISEQSSEFECGREIVKHTLTSEPCILMFDGLDEVLLNQVETAKQILKIIVTLKSAKVFVATRPHLQIELENSLHVLGYTINPFTNDDQMNFLVQNWMKKGAADNETLKQFAMSCLTTIRSNFERDIVGIPLQCRLLAEAYSDQAVRCSQRGFLEKSMSPLHQISSIFEMYWRHMKMIMEKACDNCIINCEKFRLLDRKSQIDAIKTVHMHYALELLFPERAQHFPTLQTLSIPVNQLCAIGFVEATNREDFRFVQRTLAEFFVAWFAVEMKMHAKITPFFLDELLGTTSKKDFITTPIGKATLGTRATFNYPVITYFINGFSQMNHKDHRNQSHRVSMLLDSVYYEQVSRILLASAVSDYQFVPFAVSLCFEPLQISEHDNSDILELFLISAKYSSVALMKTFCSQRDLTNLKSQSKIDSFELTPLHVAMQRGHYLLVEFLAQKYEPELKNLRYLLHFCVFESLKDNEGITTEKAQIIKLLCIKSRVWLDEKLGDGTVPLLQKNVSSELIKCLIECGADVNVLDKNENSILHKITEIPVTPEFYYWLVVRLNEHNFKYFNHSNKTKVCPLHCALENVELLADSLNYFQSNTASFNAKYQRWESPLVYAIRGKRSVELICALIELGADWKITNDKRETVLHICAEHGHHCAMLHFVKILKMDVNAEDEDGNTPLHVAVMRRTPEYELMQELLITSGADINAQTKYESRLTPFRRALRFGKGLSMRIIKLMEQRGLSIKADEATEALIHLLFNTNIMSLEISTDFAQVIEFLIGKGAEIKNVQVDYEYVKIWDLDGVQVNLRSVIQATDMSCLWPHLKTCGLLTESELQDFQNRSTVSINDCQRFFDVVQTKKGSFERVCLLLIASKQISSLSLLRRSFTVRDVQIFVTPPAFTNQFIHSQQTSGLTTMALVTTTPKLTICRICDTISKNMVDITEPDISFHLQKSVDDDLIVVKVPVVTTQLISKLEPSRAAQGKIIFVCSAVNEDVENCHVVTDTLPTWDDISATHSNTISTFQCFNSSACSTKELFKSPLIISKLPQHPLFSDLPQFGFSVMKFKVGHIDMEFQSKSYLCPTIFHYFLPEKLVFQGISIEKLKEFARFGHKIGTFGKDDMDDLDYVLIENSPQFDEICKPTGENVHLVEYEQENGLIKLVRTWGWDDNIQRFLKTTLCEGFPHCCCTPNNENLAVSFTIKTGVFYIRQKTECLLPIHELTPKSLEFMRLEDAEEFFNITVILNNMCGKLQVEIDSDFIHKSHSDNIVQLVTEHLSTLLVENSLNYVAINTLFPNLAKQANVISGLEKYKQLGMLEPTDNNRMVFVHQSLAWYFIAKLLMGLPETTEFDGITSALRKEAFQNCFEHQDVKLTSGSKTTSLYVGDWRSEDPLSSYKFINTMCFKFMNALLQKTSEGNNSSLSNFLESIITADPEGYKWIHACVNANLFHLLQLIFSFKINALSSVLDFDKLVVLAVNYADVPITRLVAMQFEKKMNRKLTEIEMYIDSEEISMVSLAALRGNFSLVEYLLKDQSFGPILQKIDKLGHVGKYFVKDTQNISGYEVNERKRIVDLLLRTDETFLEKIQLSSKNIHVDLITYLINRGVDVRPKNEFESHILHLCPDYLTPQEYHQVVDLIHAKDNTSIARLLQQIGPSGGTAFHVALEHLELLDETIALFSEAGVNFNTHSKGRDSVLVHAAKNLRSARLLDALSRSGADIHAKDKDGQPASVYCQRNPTALRYLSFRGVAVYDTHDDDETYQDDDNAGVGDDDEKAMETKA